MILIMSNQMSKKMDIESQATQLESLVDIIPKKRRRKDQQTYDKNRNWMILNAVQIF